MIGRFKESVVIFKSYSEGNESRALDRVGENAYAQEVLV